MYIIFKTDRLIIRRLKLIDFDAFHEMQSNFNVMQFVRSKPMTFNENKEELNKLIISYDRTDNDFCIYAVVRKSDATFVGTIALVKDANDDNEIGYRFLEKYWNNGYGAEIMNGIISYCKKIGFHKIIACVVIKNEASHKIIKNAKFKFIKNFVSDDLKVPEKKYELIL